jgi:hypothetical protein
MLASMLPWAPHATQVAGTHVCAAGWTWGPCCRLHSQRRTQLSCCSAAPLCSVRLAPKPAEWV